MSNYNYGAPCLSCLECHGNPPCQAPHEGGLGKRGLAAWAAVHEYAVDEADLNRLANQWLAGCEIIVNGTPHDINIMCGDPECHQGRITDDEGMDWLCTVCRTLHRSPVIVRVSTVTERQSDVDNIPVFRTNFGEVEGLPEKKDRIFIVVSRIVRAACPNRSDLLCPGEIIRNVEGKPIGCTGLSR